MRRCSPCCESSHNASAHGLHRAGGG
jgi:hypothetical protein